MILVLVHTSKMYNKLPWPLPSIFRSDSVPKLSQPWRDPTSTATREALELTAPPMSSPCTQGQSATYVSPFALHYPHSSLLSGLPLLRDIVTPEAKASLRLQGCPPLPLVSLTIGTLGSTGNPVDQKLHRGLYFTRQRMAWDRSTRRLGFHPPARHDLLRDRAMPWGPPLLADPLSRHIWGPWDPYPWHPGSVREPYLPSPSQPQLVSIRVLGGGR